MVPVGLPPDRRKINGINRPKDNIGQNLRRCGKSVRVKARVEVCIQGHGPQQNKKSTHWSHVGKQSPVLI